MLKQLSGMDSMFLYAESHRAPLEVGALQIYDPSTAPDGIVRSDFPLLPQAITSFGATALNGWLYVLGGYSGTPHEYSKEGQSGAFYRLNLQDGRTWQELPGIEHLQSVALAAHGDSLIRIGGMRAANSASEAARLDSVTEVARFGLDTGTWQPLPDLPKGRSSHNAVVVGDTLYVLGGWQLVSGDDLPALLPPDDSDRRRRNRGGRRYSGYEQQFADPPHRADFSGIRHPRAAHSTMDLARPRAGEEPSGNLSARQYALRFWRQ